MATYWENSCSFGLRYVSWYGYLIVSLVFSHLGFWSGNLFLIAPFPDLCLLVPSHSLTCRLVQFTRTASRNMNLVAFFFNYKSQFKTCFHMSSPNNNANYSNHIRKTCPCNVYPLIPHFYIVKLGYAGVDLIFFFFFFCSKI